jgi:hypothetical protein
LVISEDMNAGFEKGKHTQSQELQKGFGVVQAVL